MLICLRYRLAERKGRHGRVRSCLKEWWNCLAKRHALARDGYRLHAARFLVELVRQWRQVAAAAVAARTARLLNLQTVANDKARMLVLGRAFADWLTAAAEMRDEKARSLFRKQLSLTAAAALAGLRRYPRSVGPSATT
jgi:hypothetical protein